MYGWCEVYFLYFFVRGNWNRRVLGIFGRLILIKWGLFYVLSEGFICN